MHQLGRPTRRDLDDLLLECFDHHLELRIRGNKASAKAVALGQYVAFLRGGDDLVADELDADGWHRRAGRSGKDQD